MKKFTKLLGIVLIMALVMSMGITAAFATDPAPAASTVKIEVTRDDTYAGDASAAGRTFTWYKVFSATYDANTSTVGGYDGDGTPGSITASADAAAYIATAAVAAKLGTWVAASTDPETGDPVAAHWEKATGNLWFDLTPIAGSTNYSVAWATGVGTDTDTAQAAAKWLKQNAVYESTGSLTFADGKWSATGLDKGYYLLESDTGDNLVAATTDITIKEKNAYPPLDKTQKDEDAQALGNDDVDVAVGDVIDYQVKVTIPTTAKTGDKILVWDKASSGLSYVANSLTVTNTANATVEDPASADVDSTWTWSKLITVTDGSQGKDVLFAFKMTVTDSALVDKEKENESGLKYGRDGGWTYNSLPDKVEYKTYFAGIEKIDGQNASVKLKDVEFTLKEGEAEFKVSKPTGKDYYIPDANGSSTVVTAEDGTIKIRGLDGDKTYTLTETKNPNNGYNMLAEPVTLTLHEDTYKATETTADGTTTVISDTCSYDGATVDTWQDVVNNKGTVLPSTGGIGTTIFYVVGSILVVAAGVLLITKKRMSREG